MIFHCFDLSSKTLIFKYASPNDAHDCISARQVVVDDGCNCGKERYYIVKKNEKHSLLFAICFEGIKVRTVARFFAKHTIGMYLMANPIIDSRHDKYEDMVKASIHNTKNLNSQITSKILSYVKEVPLSQSKDKVAYIEGIINNNPRGLAREILTILKISAQISNDYNVIDYLKPNISIKKNEFGYQRVHPLIVMSFYHFESDFNAKGVFVNVSSTDLSVYVNYNTVQTLLTHIFTNALRYVMPKTNIIITAVIEDEFIAIKFQMKSLHLTDNILKNGRVNGVRSDQAKKMHEKGTGMGLGIIHALSKLNRGCFDYNRTSNVTYPFEDYIYSDNYFTIRLLKEEFYN